ncbi:MAG: hypothetical protein H8F28_13145 [Fibrella sp.]|nr:hypothetical protein [Armatimonadota bacterium]
MTEQNYYRRAVWSPIIAPLLALLYLCLSGEELRFDDVYFPLGRGISAQSVAAFLVSSLFWGGVPYLAALWWYWKQFRVQDELEYKSFFWLAPWLMMIPLFVWIIVTGITMDWLRQIQVVTFNGPSVNDFLLVMIFTSIATMALGYSYFVWTHALFCFLRAIGYITADTNAGTRSAR